MSHKNMSKRRKEDAVKKQKMQKKVAIMLIVVVILACAGGAYYLYQEDKKQEEALKAAEEEKKEKLALSKENTNKDTVNIEAISEYLQSLENIELLSTDLSEEASTSQGASSDAVSR